MILIKISIMAIMPHVFKNSYAAKQPLVTQEHTFAKEILRQMEIAVSQIKIKDAIRQLMRIIKHLNVQLSNKGQAIRPPMSHSCVLIPPSATQMERTHIFNILVWTQHLYAELSIFFHPLL